MVDQFTAAGLAHAEEDLRRPHEHVAAVLAGSLAACVLARGFVARDLSDGGLPVLRAVTVGMW